MCLAVEGETERGARRGVEHVQHAVGKALAGIGDTAGHRQRLKIVERVGDLLVDGADRVLILALDGERGAVALAHAEDVDAAVLADDRLADADLAIDLEPARAVAFGEIAADEVGVLGARHSESENSSRPGSGSGRPGGTWPSPNSRSRSAVSRTASGLTSVPRKLRPRRSAATPTLPEPMNGSATISPATVLCVISTSDTAGGFSAG